MSDSDFNNLSTLSKAESQLLYIYCETKAVLFLVYHRGSFRPMRCTIVV